MKYTFFRRGLRGWARPLTAAILLAIAQCCIVSPAQALELLLPAASIADGSAAKLVADESVAPAPVAASDMFCQGVTGPCGTGPRPQDQLWMISHRAVGCSCDPQVAKIAVWRYEHGGNWVRSSLDDFFAADDPALPTCFYVHGNQISHSAANSGGWSIYKSLIRRTTSERPIRYVIWSWPADKLACKMLVDVRIKSGRTAGASHYLARVVNRIQPDVPISFIGYSFGARIVTGALHLLAGGTVGGNVLGEAITPARRPMRAVLVASATDSGWLLPGCPHGRALSQLESLLQVNNSCDRALKWYHLIQRGRGGPSSLGYTGLYVGGLAKADRAKVYQMDVCCDVGHQHNWVYYFDAPRLLARTRPFAFWLDLP